jgi:hypothetical protein
VASVRRRRPPDRRTCPSRARDAAGLEDLSPHDLRHTAASLLVASGANVKAVHRMLGHASVATTLDVYSGLFDDDLGGLAERMGAAHDAHTSSRRVGRKPDPQDHRSNNERLTCPCTGGAGGARTHDPGIMSPML